MGIHRTSLTLKCARTTIALGLLTLLTLLTLGYSSPALAAPADWKSVDVSLFTDQQSLMLVSGTLPEEIPLPYEGELAVPAGAQFLWIGEILGGDPSKDPALQYVKRTEGDLDIYTFTLTQSRTAQVEVKVAGMSLSDGVTNTTTLTWKAWTDLPSVRIAERFPTGSELVQSVEGATLQPVGAGYSYYAKTVEGVKAGDLVELAFSYKPAASPPAASSAATSAGATASTGTSSRSTTTTILAVIVVALLIVFIVAFARASRTGTVEAPLTPPAKTAAGTPTTAGTKSTATKATTAAVTAAVPDVNDAFFDEEELAEANKPARRRR